MTNYRQAVEENREDLDEIKTQVKTMISLLEEKETCGIKLTEIRLMKEDFSNVTVIAEKIVI